MLGYIYVITNIVTNKQYIGQTKNEIKTRFNQHKSNAKNNVNTYLYNSMRKYGIENFEIEQITFIDYELEEELSFKLNELEKHYIKKYNTLSPNGYNMTKGGCEGSENHKIKVDEYDLIGNFICTHDSIKDAAKSIGKEYDSSSIWKCCMGKSLFAYQRIWRYHSDLLEKFPMPNYKVANRDHKLSPVDQYSKDGKFIQSFDSVSDAARYFKAKSTSHIIECCNGKICTSLNFVWRYKGEPFDIFSKKDNRFIGCKQFDLDGNLLNVFSSFQDACISIGKNPSNANPNITACCKGNRKTAYGYKWTYA